MKLKLLLVLLIWGNLYITQCEVLHMSQKEGTVATLYCGRLAKGKVTWSRDINGKRVDIFTVNWEMIKHIPDPDRRYSLQADPVLTIIRVSQSDAGRYYCDGNTVELTVTPKSVSVLERWLMFGGVGLAALVFLLATAAAGRAWRAEREAAQNSSSE